MNPLQFLAKLVTVAFVSLGIFSPAPAPAPTLGAAITQGGALYDGYLISGIGKNDTSMTVSAGSFRDGTSLSGTNCFTVDVNTPSVEYVCGTASGTSITSLTRGLQLVNPNASSSALAFSHNRFASVQITDYPDLQILKRILNGTDVVPNALTYASTVSRNTLALNTSSIPNVDYVNNVASSGAPSASNGTPGLVQIATTSQIIAGSDGSPTHYVVPSSFYNVNSSATTTVPVTSASGTLATGFICQSSACLYSFAGSITSASTTLNGTTTVTGIMTNSATTTFTKVPTFSAGLGTLTNTFSSPSAPTTHTVTTSSTLTDTVSGLAFTPHTEVIYYQMMGQNGSGVAQWCTGVATFSGNTLTSDLLYSSNAAAGAAISSDGMGFNTVSPVTCGTAFGSSGTQVTFTVSTTTASSYTLTSTFAIRSSGQAQFNFQAVASE